MPQRKFRTLKEVLEAVLADIDSCDSEDEPEICTLPPEDGATSKIEDINDDTFSAEEPGDVCKGSVLICLCYIVCLLSNDNGRMLEKHLLYAIVLW